MLWQVTAQVESGRTETGTVACESTSRDYILKRFLARYIHNPGRLEFWYYWNKANAKITKLDTPAHKKRDAETELDLPDPKSYTRPDQPDWPAVYR